jgi:uncharacterized protein
LAVRAAMFGFGLALLLPSRGAFAASFDCAKAATRIEKQICSDPELSKLDEQVADAYKTVLARDSDWKGSQRDWLTQERNKCTEPQCLKKAYSERLAYLEAPSSRPQPPTGTFSFEKPPYINPRIVEALTTWESDHGDQIVAINLTDSQKSNRFFGDTLVKKTPKGSYVHFQRKTKRSKENEGEFGYIYLGRTSSGTHVLCTYNSGGGSGVFESILFVTFESDLAIDTDGDGLKKKRPRLLVKAVGSYFLGDRTGSTVNLKGDDLVISEPEAAVRTIRIP